jgi:flavodoxin
MDGAKILVAYFSATGTTESVAEKIADATGGQLYEIVPEKEYTSADLNWNDDRSRSSVEMNNPESRPSLGGSPVDVAAYGVVFIGYPIWWDQAPRIVNTFIESHDLKGKTVIPFATSGGSGISNSVEVLKKTYPGLNIQEGKLLNNASSATIRSWLDNLK